MRTAEDTQKRLQIFERLNLALDGEPIDLALEAQIDAMALSIASLADDMAEAAVIIDMVAKALAERAGANWGLVKRQQAAEAASERLQ